MKRSTKSHVSERVNIRATPVFIQTWSFSLQDVISKRWCIILCQGWLLDGARQGVLDGPIHEVLIAIGADTESIDNCC